MFLTMIILALVIGLIIPFQGIITAGLAQRLEHAYASAFINFIGGTIIFGIAIMLSSASFPSMKKMSTIPWYLYSGGVIGSLFIFGALFSLPRVGASAFFSLIVLGQLLMTLVIDHYGILGMPIHKIDTYKACGIILLILGSFLVIKK